MMLTFVLTIAWDIEVGIAVSLIISLLLVVRRSAKPRMTILVRQLDLCINQSLSVETKFLGYRVVSPVLRAGYLSMRTRRQRKMFMERSSYASVRTLTLVRWLFSRDFPLSTCP